MCLRQGSRNAHRLMDALVAQLDEHACTLEQAHRQAVQTDDLKLLLEAVQAYFAASPDLWTGLLHNSLLATDVQGACSDFVCATNLKADGNAAFQHEDYARAIDAYTGDVVNAFEHSSAARCLPPGTRQVVRFPENNVRLAPSGYIL